VSPSDYKMASEVRDHIIGTDQAAQINDRHLRLATMVVCSALTVVLQ
jgi:hypothetical protein